MSKQWKRKLLGIALTGMVTVLLMNASTARASALPYTSFPLGISESIFQLIKNYSAVNSTADSTAQKKSSPPKTAPLKDLPTLKETSENTESSQRAVISSYTMDPRNFEFTTPYYTKDTGLDERAFINTTFGMDQGRFDPAMTRRHESLSLLSL